MVLAHSHEIPRAPCYSGTHTRRNQDFSYGALTHSGRPSQTFHLSTVLYHYAKECRSFTGMPYNTTHTTPDRSHTCMVWALPLSLATTHRISLPRGTKMFHFPPHHQRAIHSHASDHQQRWPGFPIRTPSDHSPLVDSPRLNADRHVLLRPFMPRHPPNALKHLQKQTKKSQQTTVHCHTHNQPQTISHMRSRCSHPLYNSQTPHQHPTTPDTNT